MKKKTKKIERERTLEIRLVATFGCTYPENATNICMALAQAGRYVQVRRNNSAYEVEVYEQVR